MSKEEEGSTARPSGYLRPKQYLLVT